MWRPLVVAGVVAVVTADLHPNCAGWAQVGECTANPNYMLPNCPEACAKFAGPNFAPAASFYDLSATTSFGERLDFASLEGKVVLVTNVASL
ncbi:hypothetical protein CTAYLR_007136 [Chrysophaeum taylorii]|uniref:ShKT domain-containing protein n=1 Tax=Chrysophaeum taylorii TaxID=2483200 RepID=A0AAD7XHH8_9STRA|nr:hypothetical protein CTAYLR_007136 [Chrysophaeum taylorii]